MALGQLGLDRAGAATDDEASTAFGDELFEVMGGKGAHLGWVTAMAFAPAAAMVQRLCCVDPKGVCAATFGPARRTTRDRPNPGEASGWSCVARDFVTQHQKSDVLGRRRAAQHHQQIQQVEEDQIEQTQRHSARSCSES